MMANENNEIDNNVKVRTNVTQSKAIVPWYDQGQNKTHFEAANRYIPLFDGLCDNTNNCYVELVRRSIGACDTTTIKMSEEMKKIALVVTKNRLTQVQSAFRTEYRGKLVVEQRIILYHTFIVLSWH
jgi:hypothetical protein